MKLDTPICDFGWPAVDFSLPDVGGKMHSLGLCMGKNGLLVMFICNHCPFVMGIGNRLAADSGELLKMGVGVVAIMSNDYIEYPEDSPENMRNFAAKFNFPFPYLVDETQEVGKKYGAVCTPDFFGFNKQGQLQYRGRLDNTGRNGEDSAGAEGRVPELLNAMEQIAKTGEGPKQQTPSAGCSIKWRQE